MSRALRADDRVSLTPSGLGIGDCESELESDLEILNACVRRQIPANFDRFEPRVASNRLG